VIIARTSFPSVERGGLQPDYSTLDDAALVKRARSDTDAFAVLYRRYLTPLYRYLYRRLGNDRDAEDLTAQVFTEALEGLAAYRERGRFASWLFTIARRRLVDLYRQRVPAELDDPPDGAPGLQAALEQGETYSHLGQLLQQLTEEQQELLRLRFAAGLEFAEIAAVLGRSTGSVKMSFYRTLEWLRSHWEIAYEP
jgi:RNA polymerase sigma-70 factor (ECF subfamily)